MGVLDGQPVDAAVTNPAFINKNQNDQMPNILGLTNPFSGTIADIQAAANKLYLATGASETQSGTVYNAPSGTITNGQNHQSALSALAGKFDALTGHMHTGAPGDAPVLTTAAISNSPTFPQPVASAGVLGTSGSGFAWGNHQHQGVHSIAASGATAMVGDVVLQAGVGVQLSQTGNVLQVSASGAAAGVTSLAASGFAAETGDIVLVAGSGISLSASGQQIQITATGASGSFLAPTVTYITPSTSTGGQYFLPPNVLLTVTAGSASPGAVYHDGSGNIGTVIGTISGIMAVHMTTGTGFNSSPITKTSGTGTATISFSFQNGTTNSYYAPPGGVLYLEIEAQGGGGGGSGSTTVAAANAGAGSVGGDTTFGSALIVANGGAGAAGNGAAGGVGGAASLGGLPGRPCTGGDGAPGGSSLTGFSPVGGDGGFSALGGGGSAGFIGGGIGSPGKLGTGGGGGGGGGFNNASGSIGGSGGGSGGNVWAVLSAPAAYYAVAPGSGGTGGTAGTSGASGGAGGGGSILVTERYQ